MSNSDFERDLFASATILAKIQTPPYAQHLYAALCNNELHQCASDNVAGYSWRSAGGLVAELETRTGPQVNTIFEPGSADYMRWYCTGIFRDDVNRYVGEGTVTEEIRNDLFHIGWRIVPLRHVEGEK